ncbi:DUF4296 domain-containing protein [Winogradskyella ludwigii]|uniref:DUF4296 domain-containing protein n=1 Tax=Winogradskyella ludwigii TaxID=2686076 RepID=UPI0015C89CEE|nr:DUF4296 domain-containing protein [Winogradskyella ludwigii]
MLKRISILSVLCVLVFACNGFERPEKPDDLMSKAQMADFLYDLYIINSAKGVNKSTLEKKGFNPKSYVFEKYDIDSTRFAESNAYYTSDTEAYGAIIDEVKARLESDKERFDVVMKKENDSINKRKDSIKTRRDSIKKLNKVPKESLRKPFEKIDIKKIKTKGL